MLVPSPGSKLFVGTYTSGMAFESVNEKPIEQRIVDGNYVVASEHPRPWIKQLNLLAAYFYFFNPLRMFVALLRPKSAIPHVADETSPPEEVDKMSRGRRRWRRIRYRTVAHFADAAMQLVGMMGLFHTFRHTIVWAGKLLRGKIKRCTKPPGIRIPMRGIYGEAAPHALPGTPVPADNHVQVTLEQLEESGSKAA